MNKGYNKEFGEAGIEREIELYENDFEVIVETNSLI